MNQQHVHPRVQRYCDVCIVGGAAAGLAAALQLVRQRRSVIVVDSGEPRNAPAAHMHGYLGYDGAAPAQFLDRGRAEVRSYGGEILHGRVSEVTRADDDGFRVELDAGHAIFARRVLAATGMVDELPDIEGLPAEWGQGVVHCPFCHGYELRDRRVVHIVTHPLGLHTVPLFRQLSAQLTVVLHEAAGVAERALDSLRGADVGITTGAVSRVRRRDGRLCAVELADGTQLAADAVTVGPRFRVRAEPFQAFGLRPEPHPSGLGDALVTDAAGLTDAPGVYAAGNVTDPSQQVLHAAADGSRVGAMISYSLAEQDLQSTAPLSGNRSDWDHRYSGEQMWSGNPNGTLVAEVETWQPGRALDVGAGEGGDAIWLAERGWTVTASDISARALERVAAASRLRGVSVEQLQVDANALDAFGPEQYDLVSAQYASIPRTPDRRGIRNLLDAVAPGGALLVVNHDPAAMAEVRDRQPFDPDAYVSIDEFLAVLADSEGWQVEVNEKRPRPPGAASHHVDDVVLRARRLERVPATRAAHAHSQGSAGRRRQRT